jgi:hypothetical protein
MEHFTEALGLDRIGSNPNPETLDPDRWTDEFAFLSQPGEADNQIDLF